MGTDVKVLLAIGTLVVVAGLGYLVFGPRVTTPNRPLLGYVDTGPPEVPRATGPAVPPFKLPWWK